MNDQEFRAVATTKEQAHRCILQAYAHAQALLGNGERVVITAAPLLESIGVRQRNFLHGAVLAQISEQARVGGDRFVMEIWKAFYQKLYLPDTWEMRRLPGQKKATPVRVRHSTEELGVKGYSLHIDRVIAHAVTELGVQFRFEADEREAVRHQPAQRAKKADTTTETQPA